MESANERNAGRGVSRILLIILAKVLAQRLLLVLDSIVKEAPRRNRIADDADRIGEQQLRADRPPEPAAVGRMAEVGVDAGSDEFVRFSFVFGNLMREIAGGRVHGRGAQRLKRNDHHQRHHKHQSRRFEPIEKIPFDEILNNCADKCIYCRVR